MKKIFTLVSLALLCVGSTYAQDEIYSAVTADGQKATEFQNANLETVTEPYKQLIATVNGTYVTVKAISGALPADVKVGGDSYGQDLTINGDPIEQRTDDSVSYYNIYNCTVNSWSTPEWKTGNHGDTGFKWVVGTGNPYTGLYAKPTTKDGDPVINPNTNQQAYTAVYDYYLPDGSKGLPLTGEYVSIRANEDGMLKIKAWVNKGGSRKLYIIDKETAKALEWNADKTLTQFKVEGYVNGQKNEDGSMRFFDYMTVDNYLVEMSNQARLVWFVFNVKKDKEYLIMGSDWQFGFCGYEFYKGKDISTYVPAVVINPASGTNLADEITAAMTANPDATDFIANLAADAEYTVDKAITTGKNLTITGSNGHNAIIDASALKTETLSDPFIKLDGATVQAKNQDGTENANYKSLNEISISNVTINNLQTPLVKDAQKILVNKLAVDNVIVEVSGSNNFFDFNGKGYIADLAVTNSTLWSKTSHTGYFFQAGGRVRDLDNDQLAYKQVTAIKNSTLYKIAVGKELNNYRGNGQKSLVFDLENVILFECSKDANLVKGWLGGAASANPTVTYVNNTYWYNGLDNSALWTSGAGSDQSGTAITTNPGFVDAANGDFTLHAGSEQARLKTGDPRWLVEYDATGIENVVKEQTVVNGNAALYNLAGQKVDKDYKGIVIQKGKKYLMRK